MMFPTQSMDALIAAHPKEPPKQSAHRQIYTQLCSDPAAPLNLMHDPAISSITATPARAFLQEFFQRFPQSSLPPPPPQALFTAANIASRTRLVQYPTPVHLLAWRIDRPTRMILYTGASCPPPSKLDPLGMQPHTFQKILLEERTRRPQPSVVQFLEKGQENPSAAVRASLAAYAKHRLTPFFERVPVPRQPPLSSSSSRFPTNPTRNLSVANHILEEVIACFIHAPPKPENHTVVSVNGATQWDKAHIDPRSVFVCVCVYLWVPNSTRHH
jgi:hypothetical protein